MTHLCIDHNRKSQLGITTLLLWAGLLLASLLSACGGNSGDTTPEASLSAPSAIPSTNYLHLAASDQDAPMNMPQWANLSMRPTRGLSPEASVQLQSQSLGRKILWPGETRTEGFSQFNRYIDLASQNPSFEMVYVYDELFWDANGYALGALENEVLDAAAYARRNGLRPGVSILPNVILHRQFQLRDINAFDVIAIDVYPSMLVDPNSTGCTQSANLLANQFLCARQKLRDIGYTGEVWYVYQAFALSHESTNTIYQNMSRQQEALTIIRDSGVQGIAPFGMQLGTFELQREPGLVPGAGSWFEYLLNPTR